MAIHIEVSRVAMHLLANPVGQPADRQNIACPIKRQRIGLVKPLAGKNLILDWEESRIVSLKCV